MERRRFVKSLLAAGLIAPRAQAQSAPDWGGPVLDTHLHLRKDADSCLTHMQGCGVTNAILLTPAADQERAKQEMERRPGRFARSVRTDPAMSGADKVLRDASTEAESYNSNFACTIRSRLQPLRSRHKVLQHLLSVDLLKRLAMS